MSRHLHPAWLAFGGSLLVFATLLVMLFWSTAANVPGASAEPVVLQCAAALRSPLEVIATNYERETGQRIELRFGSSESLLTNIAVTGQGDLFLPADESYVQRAKHKDLIAEVLPLATMRAVVIVRPNLPEKIAAWNDLVRDGVRLAQGNPDATAIGKLTRQHLQASGRWAELEKRTTVFGGTVTEVANAVQLGSVDAGIIFDAVATQYPNLTVVSLPELEPVAARVELAVLRNSSRPTAALQFARYVAAKDQGLRIFAEHGFAAVETGDAAAAVPEIVLYSGAMLQPAIEQTITEFEKREGVRVIRVYNGCGILVSQMRAGERPDLYFACDTQFMNQVRDLFGPPEVISNNHLVIAVPRGNPKEIKTLRDLAMPGLRLGVGHEQQCALGAITKETFLQTGVYASVVKNVVVQSPTGDYLVNQLRTGSLDAVVAYISNVKPYEKDLEAIPVTGIPCASPQQPIAVSKSTRHRRLAERLLQAIRSTESKERFEHLGFGWEIHP